MWYWVKDPVNGELRRVVVKCNRMRTRRENVRQARMMAESINVRLREGWNPFVETMKESGCAMLGESVALFLQEKEKELRPDSMRCYRSYCTIFSTWLESHHYEGIPVPSFTEELAGRFLTVAGRNVSNRTYNGYVRFYRTMFNWFIGKHYCQDNPFMDFKTKRAEVKHRDTIPPEVREEIREYLLRKGEDGFYQVCMMCYRMLIRPKEIMMLKAGMVDTDGWLVTIPAEVAKNHNERVVAVPEDMRAWFRCLEGCSRNDYVFSTGYRPGRVMLTSRDVGRTWQRLRKALGFSDKYTFYSLKDTGITEMLEHGVPPKLVKDLADHHSLEMTERYIHKSAAREILKYDVLKF